MPDEELDPKLTHDMDQGLAAFRHMGATMGQMMRGMIEEGMSKEDALYVVGQYALGWGQRLAVPELEEDQ